MSQSVAPPKVFISIVTWNHARCISQCIELLFKQNDWICGDNLLIQIFDNSSSDSTSQILSTLAAQKPSLNIFLNPSNVGFSAAHNYNAASFLATDADFFLVLNPDVALTEQTISEMVIGFSHNLKIGLVTPKLLRADQELRPLTPSVLDAAGMIITKEIRHFDRGSGELDQGQYEVSGAVFGGTGACLMISRDCVRDLEIVTPLEQDLKDVYPVDPPSPRAQLFDEAFFAYREDADLAWRSQWLGWLCLYNPRAVAYHTRVVTPERRSELPAFLNLLGVQNRFLLELNNWSPTLGWEIALRGIIFRNLIVLLGVVFTERGSLQGVWRAIKLSRRALRRRDVILKRAQVSANEVGAWFGRTVVINEN